MYVQGRTQSTSFFYQEKENYVVTVLTNLK